LTWQSKRLSGSTYTPEVFFSHSANCTCRALGVEEFAAEAAIGSERPQLAQLVQIRDPALADRLRDRTRQCRVREAQPAARRDAVGLVVEALGKHFRKIAHGMGAQQLRMDLRNAVGAVRADNREMRHAHVLGIVLVDQAHARQPPLIAGEARAHLVEEPPVDLENDLQLTRQQQAEHLQRPLLQRFAQQCVIRVCQRLLRQVPGFVQSRCSIEQNAHERCDRERRVRKSRLIATRSGNLCQ
jgi:hypothetical protein